MKQRHWLTSHKVLAALATILLIAVIGILSSCSGGGATTPPTTTPAAAATPTPTVTPTTPPPTSTPPKTTTPPPTTTPAPATPQTVLSLTGGDVYVKHAGETSWVKVESGTTLVSGDHIKTTGDAHAQITFFEGSTIELNGETEIAVSELALSSSGSTTIHLQQFFGNTVSRVNKLTDSASTYEVETTAAVAAVRGSTMSVTVMSDGTVIVTNEGGDIRVFAQGKEVIIPEGMKVTIKPGQEPGEPEPILSPTPTPPPTPVINASAVTNVTADHAEAAVGETVNYTYTVTNTGAVPLSDVRIIDNVTGMPLYQGGDTNANGVLDPVETWTFTAAHVVTEGDPSPLVNTATFSATIGSVGFSVLASDQATVNILAGLYVIITSPADGATVTDRTINITGVVGAEVTSGNITINGQTHAIAFNAGHFSTNENIDNGANTITVAVTDGEGTATDTIHITGNIPIYGIRIQLTWDTDNTDLDSHLLFSEGGWESDWDCYYSNPNPDWGEEGVTTDDPSLDTDVTGGFGPENITLLDPTDSVYRFMVDYFSGDVATTATVDIWINNIHVGQYTYEFSDDSDEPWLAAIIYWPSGDVSGFSPAINVVKTASQPSVHAGDNVTYTYTITNTGDSYLENISVDDNIAGPAAYVSGDTDADGTLDLDETWIFRVVYTTNVEQFGTLTNIGTARGIFAWTEQQVTDNDTLSITVIDPLIITSVEIPNGQVDETYEVTLTATGGSGTLHWSIISGALPAGLELAGDTITGTPTEWGEIFTFTIQVTDDYGTKTLELTISIQPPGTPIP